MKLFSDWQTSREQKSIHLKASKYCTELGIEYDQLQLSTKDSVKNIIKKKQVENLEKELHDKPTHGQFHRLMDQPHIDKPSSMLWLKSSTLKRSTEASICAIQEQAITTRYIKKHVHNTSDTDICRVCRIEKETIQHIVDGCRVLAPTKYLKRHDDLGKYVHALLCKKYDIIDEIPPWYLYHPIDVIENEQAKILWNFSIQTDHEVRHNRPDITLINKRTRTVALIDISCPNDHNIAAKRMEKMRVYNDLAIEVQTLWNMRKVDIVPIVIGATGFFYKNFNDDLKKIGIDNDFDKAWGQKIVILGTCHIVRAFLQIA